MAGNKTATFLVIFVVAIVAFCLACVCASMTGQISIIPNDDESGSVLDNLSAINDDSGNSGQSYGYQDYKDYSSSSSSSSSSYDDSQVETTTDSGSSTHDSGSGSSSSGSSSGQSSDSGSSDSSSGNEGQSSTPGSDSE